MSHLSRRHFFQGAAMALSATRVMGANDQINVGLIGIGGRGNNHLDTYGRITGARLAAICDVNQAAREKAQVKIEKLGTGKAAEYDDMRKLFADKTVDAVSVATPNHWHALTTIWACEAGKDVYCEKPASHNVHESFRMVEVARRTNRMVQIGSQSRSTPYKIKAIELLRGGVIGELYMAKALCFKRRKSIGKAPAEPVPAGINWDLFLGPAPYREFTRNRFAYNWHWFWDTGNGDIGNQGVHEMDVARWGLGELTWPKSVVSTGGKYLYDDDQETPNTQMATLDYGGKQIMFEVRGLLTGPEAGQPVGTYPVGNLFYGSEGWMWIGDGGFQVFKGEKSERIMDEKVERGGGDGTKLHMENFLAACRSRNYKALNAEVEIGAISAGLCHFANNSYRAGQRKLVWDGANRVYTGDVEATKLLTRDYRKPYVV
ncbi:MAG TPA: Gfo/Idh/MocA family oxidoreductase [Paludibaculum sp.]